MTTLTALGTTARVTRADLLRTRRWPAVWIVVGAWLLLNALFGYVFDYITYTSGDSSFSNQGESRAALLAGILPQGMPDHLVQGMPMFGGALMMVLGALLAGSGYGWGTWKTAFTQGPSRAATTMGSLASLALLIIGVVLVTVVSDLCLSLGVAGLQSQHVVWPALGEVAKLTGVAVLVMGMWAMIGYLLGVLARGPAVAVGLALVWSLVIENLLRGVGASLGAVDAFAKLLPGTAAGSLVGQLVGVGDAPGVLDTIGAHRALATAVIYLAAAPLLAVLLVRRRDVS